MYWKQAITFLVSSYLCLNLRPLLKSHNTHRLNMEVSKIDSPLPPHLGSYTRAILVSQDRRHLCVTPPDNTVSLSSLCVEGTTILFHKIHLLLYRGGIQERTVGLRFLGIISRVLRLEVSTLVFCLSTRCYS